MKLTHRQVHDVVDLKLYLARISKWRRLMWVMTSWDYHRMIQEGVFPREKWETPYTPPPLTRWQRFKRWCSGKRQMIGSDA